MTRQAIIAKEERRMIEIIKVLTNYNIFNYLFPGVVFVFLLKWITKYDLSQTDIVIGAFCYYFVGIVISRIGSLVIEPVLIRMRFIPKRDYARYVKASKNDIKVELLSEVNNMYRTMLSLFVCLAIVKGYEIVADVFSFRPEITPVLIGCILIALFLFSFRKQNGYLEKRIVSGRKK